MVTTELSARRIVRRSPTPVVATRSTRCRRDTRSRLQHAPAHAGADQQDYYRRGRDYGYAPAEGWRGWGGRVARRDALAQASPLFIGAPGAALGRCVARVAHSAETRGPSETLPRSFASASAAVPRRVRLDGGGEDPRSSETIAFTSSR